MYQCLCFVFETGLFLKSFVFTFQNNSMEFVTSFYQNSPNSSYKFSQKNNVELFIQINSSMILLLLHLKADFRLIYSYPLTMNVCINKHLENARVVVCTLTFSNLNVFLLRFL